MTIVLDTVRLASVSYPAVVRADMIVVIGAVPGGWAQTCYISRTLGAWYVGSVAPDSFTLYPCVPEAGEFAHHANLEVAQ